MREKLIKLLVNSPGLDTLYGKEEEFEENADWLIANGVTVQEWISVKDRLPEEDTRVLVWLTDDAHLYTRIDTDRLHNSRWVRWGKYVTNWMPLPDPPKGE